MANNLFTIGPVTVHAYGLMIGIGIIAAYVAGHIRAEKQGLESEKLMDLIIVCVVSGFLSAKLLYWLTILPEIIADPSVILNFGSGFVVYGGIIGGIVGGYLFCRFNKYSFVRYADLMLPSVALAQGFGRVGCAIAGCCYGAETTCFCAVVYQNSYIAPNGVALIPTQAISAALNFAHFILLVIIAKKFKKPGLVSGCYLLFYSIGRYCVEMFRGDIIRGQVGAVSTSQFISFFIVVAGVAVIAWSLRRGNGAGDSTAEKT